MAAVERNLVAHLPGEFVPQLFGIHHRGVSLGAARLSFQEGNRTQMNRPVRHAPQRRHGEVTAAAHGPQKGALGKYAGMGFRVVKRSDDFCDARIVGSILDSDRRLPDTRQHFVS